MKGESFIPKIIEHLRENILNEARKELFEVGYHGLNIRQISKNCNIATGTIYNYFPSKEVLVANLLLSDWQELMQEAQEGIRACTEISDGISAIYAFLVSFTDRYRVVFQSIAMPLVGEAYAKRHQMLRSQIVAMLMELLGRFGTQPAEMAQAIMAECLLAGAMEHWDFAGLYVELKRLL